MKYSPAGAAALLAIGALVVLWRRLTLRRVARVRAARAGGRAPLVREERDPQGRPGLPDPLRLGQRGSSASAAGRRSTTSGTDTRCSTSCCCCLACSPTRSRSTAPSTSRRCSSSSPRWPCSTRVPDGSPALALACVGAYFLVWFSSVQDARYLLPAMPVLAVLAAVGIVALARQGKLGRLVAIAGTVSAFAVGGVVSVAYASRFVPYLVGRQSEEAVPARERLVQRERRLAERAPAARQLASSSTTSFLCTSSRMRSTWTADVLEDDRRPGRDAGVRPPLRDHPRDRLLARQPGQRQLAYRRRAHDRDAAHARPISSRTRHEVGAPERMDVYEIPRPR